MEDCIEALGTLTFRACIHVSEVSAGSLVSAAGMSASIHVEQVCREEYNENRVDVVFFCSCVSVSCSVVVVMNCCLLSCAACMLSCMQWKLKALNVQEELKFVFPCASVLW
jgi:hypothetical protein